MLIVLVVVVVAVVVVVWIRGMLREVLCLDERLLFFSLSLLLLLLEVII